MFRTLLLILYYGLASRLPSGSVPVVGRLANDIRRWACKPILKKMGRNVTIEAHAYIGSGKGISLGDYSGLGENCHIRSPTTIGSYVLMGPDVMII